MDCLLLFQVFVACEQGSFFVSQVINVTFQVNLLIPQFLDFLCYLPLLVIR